MGPASENSGGARIFACRCSGAGGCSKSGGRGRALPPIFPTPKRRHLRRSAPMPSSIDGKASSVDAHPANGASEHVLGRRKTLNLRIGVLWDPA